MSNNRNVAVVALLFGALILAQPNPAMADEPGDVLFNPQPDPPETDVDAAMGTTIPDPKPAPGGQGLVPGAGLSMEKSDDDEEMPDPSDHALVPPSRGGQDVVPSSRGGQAVVPSSRGVGGCRAPC